MKNQQVTTIIIGNGLGMALDSDYFKIDSGLVVAWNKLSLEQQERIKNLISDKSDLTSEQQLNRHYIAIQSCLMLNKIEKHSNLQWLHPDARYFPDNFRNFIANTAWYFFDYKVRDDQKFLRLQNFIKNLSQYVQSNKTNIATLNYDRLVYGNIVQTDIMNTLSGELVDGFHVNHGGFHPSHITNDLKHRGYYLHLHGSPLFYTDIENGCINKTSCFDLEKNKNIKGHLREHLILCNTSLKLSRISTSPLLHAYWELFRHALYQSTAIIVFGYSGNDNHVNEEISKINANKKIYVIEHADQDYTDEQRCIFWSQKFKLSENYFNSNNLRRLKSILNFEFNISD